MTSPTPTSGKTPNESPPKAPPDGDASTAPGPQRPSALIAPGEGSVPQEALAEGAVPRRPVGVTAGVVYGVAFLVSVYAIYVTFRPLPVLPYRMSFLALVLPLTFLLYRRGRHGAVDWGLAVVSVVVSAYPLAGFDDFIRRTVEPSTLDLFMAGACVILVLEATRRTVGAALPVICLGFAAYAWFGGLLPVDSVLGHRGYGVDRLLVQLYMGTEGLFGVPLDVAATYIVLFTVYGAVLEHSGASAFFVEVSLAAFRRSGAAPGRTVTLAGFLMGTVSGSGTATAVSLGSVAWPVLRRAGYPPAQGGGVLAAAGIGALLSPPTLGAAAFIIAEYLKVSYVTVLLYAVVPTILYYLGVVLAVEIDSRRYGTRGVPVDSPPVWRVLARSGYHLSSLVAMVALMALGVSPFRAVVYSTVLAFALSFLDRRRRLGPRRAARALAAGTLGVLPVAATTAAAGIIAGVVTLTGLGLKSSRIIVDLAGGVPALTALLAAAAVLLLGLAVPVTASFIIAAVVIGPALQTLGVTPEASYMFVFYYAVLSEVTPPTALAAVAAAAITGGNAFSTMMQTWKYTLPAFLVPFAFVLSPAGEALLWRAPLPQVLMALAVCATAVAALACATGGWLVRRARPPERVLCATAAALLLTLTPWGAVVGAALLAAAVLIHLVFSHHDPEGI
ncbi:TRAP transporter fused permease subunit [Spongiactinospora sp. TRM90649]|uniref:TRAP transporter permease n=1 Tax=Spongiactinospora sp. TRM90649 TaxID=3031114 RepID=UPI0023F9C2A5|nr:TRAP transporter fused permease subunit [Spongiactinospora sp. TRM90649]MDF5755850.1 TRAP transporter fused permease subunit [Spongiactinospora sp. TRM90649]